MVLFQTMMVAAMVISGMGVALLGSVKMPLARRLQIDEARVGGLVSIFGFVLVPVIFTAGFLTDLVGKQAVLMSGSLALAASLGWLALSRRYLSAFAAVVLISAGWSLLINAGNVLIPSTFPDDTAFATNLFNVFFGVGAFLTPLAVRFLVARTSLPAAVGFLGALTLLPALLAAGVDFAALAPAAEPGSSSQGILFLLGDPIMWLCGLAFFFYGPLEASMGAWTTTYLGDRGFSEATSSSLLSAFWLAYMAARLTTAFTLPRGGEAALILVLALACVAVMLAMVFSRGRQAAVAVVIGAGLVFGPIFPTIMAVLLEHVPSPLHGRAVGLFFAIGGVGWTMIPLLIGAYARRTSVQRGFTIAVAAAMGLSGVALLLVLR